MKLDCQKHLFNLEPDLHYLNNAYKSPLLKSAEEAAIKSLVRSRNPQLITPEDFFSESREVRKVFGELLHVPSQNIAIVPSTSYGFSSLLLNVKAKHKGKAITIGEEFPSGYFSLKKWCIEHAQELVIVKGNKSLPQQGLDWNKRILESIDENTSVVCMSAIHWATGLKYDLNAIGNKCKSVGSKFLVDGAQTIGALNIDIKACQIDGLVCAAYKCLFGPYSMSLMYIHDDFFGGKVLEEAWMNREGAEVFSGLSDYNESYLPGARRLNMGQTSNFILTPILLQGLRQIKEWGIENIQDYCKSLAVPFIEKMKMHGYDFEEEPYLCYHLFSVKIPKEKISIIQERLQEKNLKLSVRGEYLRISLSVFNNESDLAAFSEVLIEIA